MKKKHPFDGLSPWDLRQKAQERGRSISESMEMVAAANALEDELFSVMREKRKQVNKAERKADASAQ